MVAIPVAACCYCIAGGSDGGSDGSGGDGSGDGGDVV